MSERDRVAEPVPVTVIGGYLGSGKTTLVNHLLRTAAGRRLAVLVNEFGTLPIDEDLIEARDDAMIKIAGGCICCSYGSDMMEALMNIQRLNPIPDHVLLEASGVALPGAVAQSVGLLSGCKLDGIVVLADAETIEDRAVDPYLSDTITRQLAAADIVVLNKVDLVEPRALEETYRWLDETWPEARIVTTTHASIPSHMLLGAIGDRVQDDTGDGHAHRHDDSGTGHYSLSITFNETVDAEVLAMALADRELDLVRAKGIVPGDNGAIQVVQVVGRRWQVREAYEACLDTGRLVCIRAGKAVDEAAVWDAIQSALISL